MNVHWWVIQAQGSLIVFNLLLFSKFRRKKTYLIILYYSVCYSEAFMAAMEADARERAERRKIKEKEANILKEQGNEYFRQENYHAALDCYTKVIVSLSVKLSK